MLFIVTNETECRVNCAKPFGFIFEGGILSDFASSFSATLREVFSEKELQKKAAASGLKITKQSINDCFKSGAVVFVMEVFRVVLERQLSREFCPEFLPQFNRVCIKDSTKFNVDNRLCEYFKGTGAREGTTKACVCIQYEYDLRSGKILDLIVTDGTRNDFIDAEETKGKINKADLILRDLGYYNLSILMGFAKEGAFFVTRLNTSTLIYDLGKTANLEFKELYAYMKKRKLTRFEKQVLVSKKDRAELRLVVDIVPEQVYQERIKKINKYNKVKGWTTTEEYKARCQFNLFITNIPPEKICLEDVMLLYRLPWQVELMFKNWKSVCAVHKMQPMKYERFTCLRFAKLILIVINLQIIRNLQAHHYKKTKRKGRKNLCEIIDLYICKSN